MLLSAQIKYVLRVCTLCMVAVEWSSSAWLPAVAGNNDLVVCNYKLENMSVQYHVTITDILMLNSNCRLT